MISSTVSNYNSKKSKPKTLGLLFFIDKLSLFFITTPIVLFVMFAHFC